MIFYLLLILLVKIYNWKIIDQLEGLTYYFKNYRKTGFTFAMISSKEIATKMKIEHAFHEKRIILKKKQFDENANDKTTQFAKNLSKLITSYIW